MLEFILWVTVLVFIYVSYELFVIRKEKALENMKEGKELDLLKKKYKLDYSKIDMKYAVRLVAITNAIIISTVVAVVCLLQRYISNIILWALAVMCVGIILLVPLILICYSRIGKILVKKQGGK